MEMKVLRHLLGETFGKKREGEPGVSRESFRCNAGLTIAIKEEEGKQIGREQCQQRGFEKVSDQW